MMIPPLPKPSDKQLRYVASLLEDVENAVYDGTCAPSILLAFERRWILLRSRAEASVLISEMLAVLGRD